MSDPQTGSITFFIPCLNEEGNVGRAIDMIAGVMAGRSNKFEILVIDDASKDGTCAEVEGRKAKHPRANIVLVRNPQRHGLGRNYATAARQASGEYYMLVNGDAVEPPATLVTILAKLGTADVVVPYPGLGDARGLGRTIPSVLFRVMVNLSSGNSIRYYNGPVLHRTENVRKWAADTEGFGYQAELVCRAVSEGASYVEVPIANGDRTQGGSTALTWRNFLAVSKTLCNILRRRLGL